MVLGGARAENAPGIQRTGYEIETCEVWGEMGNILHVQLRRTWTPGHLQRGQATRDTHILKLRRPPLKS